MSCKSGCRASPPLHLGASSGIDGRRSEAKKSQPRVPDGRGTPDEGKRLAEQGPCVTDGDCEVGGWRSGVIRSAADLRPKKAGHSHDVRLPRGDACAVAGNGPGRKTGPRFFCR